MRKQVGKGGDNCVPYFLTPEDHAMFGRELDRYNSELFRRECVPRIRPFGGVRELFERIRAEGLRAALATSWAMNSSYERMLSIDGLVAETNRK